MHVFSQPFRLWYFNIPRRLNTNIISLLKWAIITQEGPYEVDSVSAHLYELGASGCMSPLSDALYAPRYCILMLSHGYSQRYWLY